MKKFTLSLLTILSASVVFAQKPALPMRDATLKQSLDLQNRKMLQGLPQNHLSQHSNSSGSASGVRTLTYVQLGNAGNGLTVLNNAANVLSTNLSLNTVCFVHRNDPFETGIGTSSQYNYDVSKDGGFNFINNLGPLNPLTDGSGEGGINGRYPQGVLFNPSGANVADSQYIAYEGTWHNGDPNGPANTWEGVITGVGRVDGALNTMTENIDSVNHGDVGIFTGMCESTPGTFWTITNEWDADDILTIVNDSNYVLLKGVWNNITRDIDWSIATIFHMSPDLSRNGNLYDINPVMAFDPSGQKGWIVLNGDFITDTFRVYQPVFIGTTDGGNTWSPPQFVDLTTFPEIMNILDPAGTGVPTTGFDPDLVVDVYGNPHYVIVIGSGISAEPDAYSIESGRSHHVFDISRFGDTYVVRDLSWLFSFRGFVGSDGANPNSEGYTEDNRCQATRTPDGKYVYFSWIESDSLYLDPNNQYGETNNSPDLWVIGEDAATGALSVPVNVTTNTAFDLQAYMPMMAPTCLRTTADDASVLPIVVLKVNEDGNFTSPASFFYLNNVTVTDEEIVGLPAVSNLSYHVDQNFPNPFSDQTQIKVTLDKALNVNLIITNILGQEVRNKNFSLSAGAHFINVSKGDLGSGVYNFTIIADGRQVSKTMVIQ